MNRLDDSERHDTKITTYVHTDINTDLAMIGGQRGMTRSALVRWIVTRWVEDQRRMADDLVR